MKFLTRNTDYALRALIYMASHERRVSAQELISELKIPAAFLRRLLQQMGKNGILQPHKGKGGGFSLRISPDKIKLVDVMEIFQGGFGLTNCIFKKAICPNKAACALRHKIRRIEENVLAELRSTSVGSLLKGK